MKITLEALNALKAKSVTRKSKIQDTVNFVIDEAKKAKINDVLQFNAVELKIEKIHWVTMNKIRQALLSEKLTDSVIVERSDNKDAHYFKSIAFIRK